MQSSTDRTPLHRLVLAGIGTMLALFLVAPDDALAQVQSKDQQKCINALNKGLAKVSGAQGKANLKCIQNFGKGQVALSSELNGLKPRHYHEREYHQQQRDEHG